MNASNCTYCGRTIVWAKNELGKSVPLDPRIKVYEIKKNMSGHAYASLLPTEDYYAEHFAVCTGKKP